MPSISASVFAHGRTVLIIAHRLSAVRHADRIIVMERGQVVESGRHETLVSKPRGLYAHLHAMQQGQTEQGQAEPIA